MEEKNAVSTHILSLANSLLTSGESCNGSILTIICDNLEHNEDFQSAKEQIPKCKICTLNCTLEELALLNFIKEKPNATQKEIAVHIGKSERTVKTMTVKLSVQGILERKNGRRNGYWVIKNSKTNN